MPNARAPREIASEIQDFYMALNRLLRTYQFRDRDKPTICGISVTQCYALEFLVHDRRLTILDLGRRLALDKSNASRVVDALERIGAVSRSPDPANHRVRWIQPTATGRRLHRQITAALKRDYMIALEPYDPSFVRRVTALLESLADRALQRSQCVASPQGNPPRTLCKVSGLR